MVGLSYMLDTSLGDAQYDLRNISYQYCSNTVAGLFQMIQALAKVYNDRMIILIHVSIILKICGFAG